MALRKRDGPARALGQARHGSQAGGHVQQPASRARAGTHAGLPEGCPGGGAGAPAPEDLAVAGVCALALDEAEELLVRVALDGAAAAEVWVGAAGEVGRCVCFVGDESLSVSCAPLHFDSLGDRIIVGRSLVLGPSQV